MIIRTCSGKFMNFSSFQFPDRCVSLPLLGRTSAGAKLRRTYTLLAPSLHPICGRLVYDCIIKTVLRCLSELENGRSIFFVTILTEIAVKFSLDQKRKSASILRVRKLEQENPCM